MSLSRHSGRCLLLLGVVNLAIMGCGAGGPEMYVPDKVPVTPTEESEEYQQYNDPEMRRFGPSGSSDGSGS